ncbi:alpha/beta hydrolase [Actinomadura sp. NPDC047616]|uniref:alpha/beta hydrolase n=1 Tax=Actinomadura sp. NPDC047616 TaxID=3155914 RepID=UPI0033E83ED2
MDKHLIADDVPEPPDESGTGGASDGALPGELARQAIHQQAVPYDGGPSPLSRAISGTLRLTLGPIVHHVPGHSLIIRTARTTVDIASRLVRADPRVRVRLADDLPREPGRHGTGRVLGEWVEPRDAGDEPLDGAILYLHGGGYVVCSPRTHRPITARLAADTGLPVLVPQYRLAPEHPFPAALEDALDAYRLLLDHGVPADRVVIAGDSAGGHLAASLTGELCRTGLPRPAGVVLFSPWVDLTCELSTREQRLARDPYISASTARRVARLVVGTADLQDPRLALLACRWTDTPPVLIQVGSREVLRPEAEALAGAISEGGGDCLLQVWNGQMHVFQMLNRVLPEADAAMSETARFVRSVLAAPAARGRTPGKGRTAGKGRRRTAARGRRANGGRGGDGGQSGAEAVA